MHMHQLVESVLVASSSSSSSSFFIILSLLVSPRLRFWLGSSGHLFFPPNHLRGYPNDGLTGVEVLPIVLTGSLKLKPQAISGERERENAKRKVVSSYFNFF